MEAVQVILPCWNEVAALPSVLASLPAGFTPLVVDNGSDDGSAEMARSLGAVVIDCPERGYGAACDAGLRAATAPVVAVMDADGSLDGADLPRLVAPILGRSADLSICSRRPAGRAAWSWRLRFANRRLAGQLSRRTGIKIIDLGPMRAARREALLDLDLRDRRSGYPAETLIAAADAGWRICQVDVGYAPRIGKSKITGTPLGALRAVQDLRAAIRS
ncbi:glycosyltransferase family 2 protein [Microlunatus elymi]|uniref:Glycosyltransferase family 2 protein n=1 Tax=Microlunatus elymi TaxID=2596828 RepID=A0A516PYB7_9ACTN|nr:glycosyltransferase family 2 protein [Microlunatus elymi]QDP96152.1 glycosyltransferase family 2 protein [Microlunatus elymi]